MSQQTSVSTSGAGVSEGGPLVAVAGFALLFNLVGLYAFTGVALCVFGYIGLTLWLSSSAGRGVRNSRSSEAGTAVLIMSWVVALVGGALVGGFHWVQYAHAAYATLVVYALAVVIWMFGRAFSAWWSWLFSLAGVAMLAAVMQLGSPPGADDMEKKESWTPVNVTAVDEAGQPIDGATVYLDLVQFWAGDPELEGDREWWSKASTESDGTARMFLAEDPRFKRLVIRVQHEPFARRYHEPRTIGAYVGHEDVRLQTVLPAHKVPYSFEVVMKRRAHPDSALLAIELKTPAESDGAAARSIKLALTTDPELPWNDGESTFNEDAVASNGRVHDVYFSGSQSLVTNLGRELAGRPLTLHVLERDSTRYGAYLELEKIHIDPISLGDDRTLPTVMLPGRVPASNTRSIADGVEDAERR